MPKRTVRGHVACSISHSRPMTPSAAGRIAAFRCPAHTTFVVRTGRPNHRYTIYHGQMQRRPSELSDLGRFEEPAVLILTSLVEEPRHGYAIVKDVEQVAGVHLGPGTLYA